jgi:hypothetical protein
MIKIYAFKAQGNILPDTLLVWAESHWQRKPVLQDFIQRWGRMVVEDYVNFDIVEVEIVEKL